MSDFAGPAESLGVGESVAAPESADGLALAGNKRQSRVRTDAVAELLEFAINGPFPECWAEGKWIKEDVDVFRKPLDQVPAFRQAGAAFEDHLVAGAGGDDSQGFRDVVVLLDDGWAQSLLAKMLRRPQYRLLEIGMFKQFHGAALLRLPAPGVRQPASSPKSNRENGFNEARKR